jgi:hypothetical protein
MNEHNTIIIAHTSRNKKKLINYLINELPAWWPEVKHNNIDRYRWDVLGVVAPE